MASAEEIPELIAGVAAAEGDQDDGLDVHVVAEGQEAGQHQNGFALVGHRRLREGRHVIRRFGNAKVAGEIELHGRAMPFF